MPRIKRETLIQETTVSQNDDSPSVVAYRVGRLEQAVKDGFESQTAQLRNIVEGFVTEKELTEAKQESDLEHKRLWGAIEDIRKASRWWVGTILTAVAGVAAIVMAVKK